MKDLDIVALQNQRNKLRYEAQSKRPCSAWVAHRKVRNEIKQKINITTTSLNSKNTKDRPKAIHGILNPKSTTLKGNINDIKKLFNSTAEHLTGKEPVKTFDI